MTNKVPNFSTEREIQTWANTTYFQKVDGSIVQVQHFQNKLYYFFAEKMGMWELAMTSIYPLREKDV